MIAYDIETNGYEIADPRFKINMICAVENNKVRIWDRKRVANGVAYLREKQLTGALFVGHNASAFDRAAILHVYGVNLKSHDTMLMAYLLDETRGQPTRKGALKLETLAIELLGVDGWKDAVSWDWHDTDTWDSEDSRWETMAQYCARDTAYTGRLAALFIPQLHDAGLWPLYESLLLPASRALTQVFEHGVCVDLNAVQAAKEFYTQQSATALAVLQELKIKNPASTKQVGALIFDEYQLDPVLWTPGGKRSTNELALKTIQFMYRDHPVAPVVDRILEYRGAQKMLGTYLDNYAAFAQASHDNRVHPSYSLVSTVTGRTSAFTPNIQNVPRDARVRGIVGAAPGKQLVQVDLSMAEMRIGAHVFEEHAMRAALIRGDDLHVLMAAAATGKDPGQISKKERTEMGKIPNFTFLFCAETQTFINQAFKDYGVVFDFETADIIRDTYFAQYPGLFPAYTRVHEELLAHDYITTQTGRRRRFPGYAQASPSQQTKWLREACNCKVQSLASDIALTMLVQLVSMGYKITAYIHDACQFEVEPGQVNTDEIKHAVEILVPKILRKKFGLELSVPLVADISIGENWGSLA